MYPIAINAAIKLYIPFSISLLCFVFVFWQSVQCIEKYIKNPQGTRLSLKHTSQINKFPAITICTRSYSKSYNIKRLERCGLSLEDYRNGKWVGNKTLDENCTNPEVLFESIVQKHEDILSHIEYSYFDRSKKTREYISSAASKIKFQIDFDYYGRCLTFSPTEKMIKSGIRQVILKVRQTSGIFFHTNGMFETKISTKSFSQIIVNKSDKTTLDLDFTVYDMYDFGGQPCETEPKFDHDACTKAKLKRKSLEKFGCTTPFDLTKDNICQDYENGSKVLSLYREVMKNKVDNCYNPCSFTLTKATINRVQSGKGQVIIRFKENIKVTEAYYLYSSLSLIAEVGGYVGLFLGVSVNQISALINILLVKIDETYSRRNKSFGNTF